MTSDYTELISLLRAGAGNLDIHDVSEKKHFALESQATESWLQAELGRVVVHQKRLCPLLETFVGQADRILDVGCGTGGTTVALALSARLAATEVIGLDPNHLSLRAAQARARASGISADRAHFQPITPGRPLSFEDSSFDLVVCSSVLEYIHRLADRQALIRELIRVARPQAHIYLTTPSPLRLRDYHTKRILGDWRRQSGFPWASPPWSLARMFSGCRLVHLQNFYYESALDRLGRTSLPLPSNFFFWLPYISTWQRVLAQKTTAAV